MGIKGRLDLIIKHLNISGRGFAKECGLSESYYKTIGEGIGADKLNKILSRYPELSARWILRGEGEMFEKVSQNYFENSGGMPKDIFDRIMKLTDTIASQQETIRSQHETIKMLLQRIPAVSLDGVARMAAAGE